MLVGRNSERSRIDAVLASARSGRPGVLVLRGDAGIGKSSLLGYARERATAMEVMGVCGVESEAELAFAGLTDLLRPVADRFDDLPPPQAEALRSALALNAEPANPLAVRVALLTLLATLAEDRPVLVTVDDVQWVDRSSMEALAFAVRRLAAERLAVVAAVRGTEPVALTTDPDVQLAVAGLADDEARELLADRSGLSRRAVADLVRAAAGNPLALLELPDPAGSRTVASEVAPPPVGPRVQRAFQERLDGLPAASRLAMGVVAADGSASVGEVVRALAHLGLDSDDLHPAELDGLVTLAGDRIELRHPLLRSVAYHALDPPRRRAVHSSFAAVLDQPLALERRTWHQAAAALGPDEAVARALDEAARAAERRGALSSAAQGFDRAASLSESDDTRAQRLLLSADAWLAAGHWDLSLDQLDRAAERAVEPGLRADVAASTGQLEAYRAGPSRGAEILVEAADRIEASDPARATRLLTYAVNACVFAADVDRAVALAHRAVACGDRAGGLHAISGAMARVEAGLVAADPSVPDTLEPLAALAEALIDSDLEDAEHVFGLVVLADVVLEHWERAEWLLDVMVRRARSTGRLFLLAFALTVRADLDWRRGRWSEAYTTATTEVWETPLDLPGVGAWLHAVQARIEAGLGLADEAEAHATAALAAATQTGTRAVEAWAGAALGFLELGRGRPQAAVDHLERVAGTLDGGGIAEPGILWWAADLAEAQWRVGAIGAARRRHEVLAAQAARNRRSWAVAVERRVAGLLAPAPADAEAAFEDALRAHRRLDAPFERARTLLLLGERRRADGHADPETPLRDARATFERLGAAPWVDQASGLLQDRGAVTGAPEPAALTRQERQVAAIVGRGATNREAADQLFLSPRTIDFHLRNIYRKLHIRSRTELAVHIAAHDGATPESATPGS